MKTKHTTQLLAGFTLLGFALNASGEEPAPKPTAMVTIAKPAGEMKPKELTKPSNQATRTVPKLVTTTTLPLVGEGPKTHIVRRGETLSAIGHRNGVSVEKLALWNRMVDPNRLFIGQTIEFPPKDATRKMAGRGKAVKATAASIKPVPAKDPAEIRVTLSSE